MKTAIILHGMPSKEEYFEAGGHAQSKKHWLPWLQRQLTLQNILAQAPELPEPYEPLYEKWLSVFEQFKIDEDTILVGHSCGAGFLVRWLSEHDVRVGKVALVAPFLDPDGDRLESDFFEFTIDSKLVTKTKGVCVFFAPDDDKEIQESVKRIVSEIPNAEVKELPGRGHFTLDDMKVEAFPELVDWLLSS